MVAFYSQEDQDIYKNNPFMPRSEYLLKAPTFNTPTVEEEKITETFGIPATQAFTNSGGGGGGGNYSGGNFQQVVDARQNRLNKPTDTSTFMGRTMGKVRDFIEPQSANQIMTSGYQEPRFQPGIIATIMGKLDNYRNLPQADQAFIAQNMGYTGPTVFGENNSGLGKDPFGINTRSAKGNYAEYVDKKDVQLTDTLTKQGGKIFDKYAVNPITGQVLDEEEFSYDPITGKYTGTSAAAIAKANQMNKMNFTKLGFYKNKKKESKTLRMQEELAKKERDRGIQTLNQRMRDEGVTSSNYNQAANIAGGGGGNTAKNAQGQTAREATYDGNKNTGTAQGYSQHYARGGRIGYYFGGLAARGMKR